MATVTRDTLSDEARALIRTDWETDDPQHEAWSLVHPSDKDPDTNRPVIVHAGHGFDELERLGVLRHAEHLAEQERTRGEREAKAAEEEKALAEFRKWKEERDNPQIAAERARKEQEQSEFQAWLASRGSEPQS